LANDTNNDAEVYQGFIEDAAISDEMREAYLTYAMTVIKGRALPDVRDGLKPVHRRIIYSMWEENYLSNRPRVKSAAVVGDVNKKYHPHGDQAIYDTMVRLAQKFSMRYPFIDGQGNFGSVDGDPPAAQRYTEVKLSKISEELTTDIEKETVSYSPSYDEQRQEPTVLPARIPSLLMNGADGIAVGMATRIPPHNLGELCDGIAHMLDNPDATVEDLMQFIKGPDFPTGSAINGVKGIKDYFTTGRGTLDVYGLSEIEPMKGDRKRIVIYQIPYQVNKAALIEKIADLVKSGKLEGISDLRDESDRTGMRIVIELKRDVNPQSMLKRLYKFTTLYSRYHVNLLALQGLQPKIFSLVECLAAFIGHRLEVITKRSEFELKEALSRLHIVEGLIKALDIIDEIIATIRSSKDGSEAKKRLIDEYEFTDIQAQAILDMTLRRLTGLEYNKLVDEKEALTKTIKRLEEILGSEDIKRELIKADLADVRKKYADVRKTSINFQAIETGDEELIPLKNIVVSITRDNYIKQTLASAFKAQRRGGKGIRGMGMKDTDVVDRLAVTTTHHTILFFTDRGRVYGLKAHRIPRHERYARGIPINNLISLDPDEKVVAMCPIHDAEGYVFFSTAKGIVKKTPLKEYAYMPTTGKIAIDLDDDDDLRWVRITCGSDQILLVTKQGKAIQFNETDVRSMGRTSRGVKGIKLSRKTKDQVIGMSLAGEGDVLLVHEKGYGKRTQIEDFPLQGRGGTGVICARVTAKTGEVRAIRMAREEDELLIISEHGQMIRSKVGDISCIGRATQGVRLMKLREGDTVAAAALMVKEDDIREDDDISLFDIKSCSPAINEEPVEEIEDEDEEHEIEEEHEVEEE
jgi:DNA gyrase subunit A